MLSKLLSRSRISVFAVVVALIVMGGAELIPGDSSVSASTYNLLVSKSSSRSSPVPLAGQTVSGSIYVFTGPDSGVSQVSFYLDDPNMVGAPRRTEGNAPYDFAGGTVSTASPFDTKTVVDGSHTISARLKLTTGETTVIHAAFTVDNN